MQLRKYKEEKDPWPPVTTKSYVPLTLVYQKELQTRQETIETIYLRIKGDIHRIPTTIDSKKVTDIMQIFNPVSGRSPSTILIEGHAGIGKTTFVKEICIEWAEGKLLDSDKLVLLLLLRDPNVQKITSGRSLIEHFTKVTSNYSKATQVYKYLEETHGLGITIIIDGFDELSAQLRHESFFRKLIEKEILQRARIVVTSRPSTSACLHDVVDRRIEILGFEKSSKTQYTKEALKHCPSMYEKLQKHLQQHPNIDAICYIPLMMSIMIFICMCQPEELPPTVTKMYESFILHTICKYLKRGEEIPTDKTFNKLEDLPLKIHILLQQLEKAAFDGLMEDIVVFKIRDIPVLYRNDPTCYGLLQSTECYSAEEVGSPTQSFNFLHLGMQEYFAAKYITALQKHEAFTLMKTLFFDCGYIDSKNVRLYNMWILYCGITKGQCNILRDYLTNPHGMYNPYVSAPVNYACQTSITGIISKHILKDPVRVLYLFQCFQEAQDDVLCEILARSFDDDAIDIHIRRLLPHQITSLGFFLSKSQRKWKELNLYECNIGDHGVKILHQYICRSKVQIMNINFMDNNISVLSSDLIADIISHLQPHTVVLSDNNITNLRSISAAVSATCTVKVLHIWHNSITVQGAVAISELIVYLEELNIDDNKLSDSGAEFLSEGIKSTNTLKILFIRYNNIKMSGTTAIADALEYNISLEVLNMSHNAIGQDGAKAIAASIKNNKKLRTLSLRDDYTINEKLALRSLWDNNTISELELPEELGYQNSVKMEVVNININRKYHSIQDLEVRFTDFDILGLFTR